VIAAPADTAGAANDQLAAGATEHPISANE
jgi:hypothetical protein